MATWTIVAKDTDPLGPNEIAAGSEIAAADGDVFIVDPSADENISFAAADGGPADFEVRFEAANPNDFGLKILEGARPEITVADGVDLGHVHIDGKLADALTLAAGNDVTMGQLDGSISGPNTITLGDRFTTRHTWKLGENDDSFTAGHDATLDTLDTGLGNDTVTFGDRASVKVVDTKDGDDHVAFGDDYSGSEIKTGGGNDSMRFGRGAQTGSVDGGAGHDTVRTETAGMSQKNVESSTAVCFCAGTGILTPHGSVAVERLRAGHRVLAAHRGPRPLAWVGRFEATAAMLRDDPRLRPIRIARGALSAGRPARDLCVSPNHRILVASPVVARMCGTAGVLVAAKKLVGLDGVSRIEDCQPVTYVHLLLERHEILFAEGLATESLYLGVETMRSLAPQQRREIAAALGPGRLFRPQARARPFLDKAARVAHLVARHRKNGKPLQESWAAETGVQDALADLVA